MIQILFILVLAELALILSLLFQTPLRKLVVMGLDQSKQGRGPLVAKSVGGTILVFFSSIIYGVFSVHKRSRDAGSINPTDEVLMEHHVLEASLIGFSLFLALMIDRLHYFIKELHILRKYVQEVKQFQKDADEQSQRKSSAASATTAQDKSQDNTNI